MTSRLPTFYLSHGGGPWPYMGGQVRQRFATLERSLRELRGELRAKLEAILVISGHWEERDFAVMANPSPPMVYDFGGYPDYLYDIDYPAPGCPDLALRVESLIRESGQAAHLDPERGYDHGTYSLLAVTHPDANTPVIQVSMRADYDPAAHLALGRALAPLRDEGVLIIGSGMSYHNFQPKNAGLDSAQFDSWLAEALVSATPKRRTELLLAWDCAPCARTAHPQEDHLLPLHVAVGAAGEDPGQVIYRQADFFGRITLSSYRFG
jgi:aromatic ring-opening dioxygenase catalytic subunit (LigB family)